MSENTKSDVQNPQEETQAANQSEAKPVLDAEGLRHELESIAFSVLSNADRVAKGEMTEDIAQGADNMVAANLAAALYGKHPLVETKLPFVGAVLVEQMAALHPAVFPALPVVAVMSEDAQVQALKAAVMGFYRAVYEEILVLKRKGDVEKEDVAELEGRLKRLASDWTFILTGAPRPVRAS